MKSLSYVQLFVTPWMIDCQAPLSMEFSRPEYWLAYPFFSPGVLHPALTLGMKKMVRFLKGLDTSPSRWDQTPENREDRGVEAPGLTVGRDTVLHCRICSACLTVSTDGESHPCSSGPRLMSPRTCCWPPWPQLFHLYS